MMKALFILTGVVAVFITVTCTTIKPAAAYADYKAVLREWNAATGKFIRKIDEADAKKDAGAVVEAITEYAAAIEKMAPEMQRMLKKYAHINLVQDPPDELKEIAAANSLVVKERNRVSEVVMEYQAAEPDVQTAVEKLLIAENSMYN